MCTYVNKTAAAAAAQTRAFPHWMDGMKANYKMLVLAINEICKPMIILMEN